MSELQELVDEKIEKIEKQREERLSKGQVKIVKQPLLDWYIWYFHSSHDNDDLDRRWYYIHPSVRSTMETFVEEESINSMGKVQGALITCGLGLIDDGLQFNARSIRSRLT